MEKILLTVLYHKLEGMKMAKCNMCGRPLKNKVSIERGMGPGCYEKANKEIKKDYEVKKIDQEELEDQENFIEEIRSVW